MAYTRGPLYCWADDEGLHIWQSSPPNTEFMEASGWAVTYATEPRAAVYLPNTVFDDLAVRHHDEMTERQRNEARWRLKRRGQFAAMRGEDQDDKRH